MLARDETIVSKIGTYRGKHIVLVFSPLILPFPVKPSSRLCCHSDILDPPLNRGVVETTTEDFCFTADSPLQEPLRPAEEAA